MPQFRRTARVRRAVTAAALALGVAAAVPVPARAAGSAGPPAGPPDFAPIRSATVHPGVVLVTDGKGCTANFVFTDAAGRYYLGQAAHCASRGEPDNFNGCVDPVLPLGTEVRVAGADVTGVLAYSSWNTMQRVAESDHVTCRANDFALVRLPADAVRVLNPSVPWFGGPVGLSSGSESTGDFAYAYGNAPIRQGIGLLAPKRGVIVERSDDDWTYLVYFLTPVIPGDSGSGVLDESGRALGVASSLIFVPHPASNGVVNLAKALAYAQQHSGIQGLRLVPGTEAFTD
ncbi:trypsin-like peptidase domain-containing protein [Sporichthya polymorpha]|uniref:trypsin-like peptidase domain-containing protein n=1 Tax=Sporichthya polymorpha TaxID=35751 RepID=UPI0003760F7B|nr:trypsin-like peptidase domain-containing protein [Sporichthya polymorpha]